MASDPTRPRIPAGADDFARALGRYLPQRLAQTRELSRMIRSVGRAKRKRSRQGR